MFDKTIGMLVRSTGHRSLDDDANGLHKSSPISATQPAAAKSVSECGHPHVKIATRHSLATHISISVSSVGELPCSHVKTITSKRKSINLKSEITVTPFM
jgi:hypothetical protein